MEIRCIGYLKEDKWKKFAVVENENKYCIVKE